jgi:hypothetical protein
MASKRVKFRKKRTHKKRYLRGGNSNGCLIPNYFIPFNPDVSKLGFPISTTIIPKISGGTRRRKKHGHKQNGGFFGADGLSTFNYNMNMSKALYSGQPLSSVPSPYPFS